LRGGEGGTFMVGPGRHLALLRQCLHVAVAVRHPVERKVFTQYRCYWEPLWKQSTCSLALCVCCL